MERTSNTLDELIGLQYQVHGHCAGCLTHRRFDLAKLRREHGGGARIGELAAKMVCRACGRRGIGLSIQGR